MLYWKMKWTNLSMVLTFILHKQKLNLVKTHQMNIC